MVVSLLYLDEHISQCDTVPTQGDKQVKTQLPLAPTWLPTGKPVGNQSKAGQAGAGQAGAGQTGECKRCGTITTAALGGRQVGGINKTEYDHHITPSSWIPASCMHPSACRILAVSCATPTKTAQHHLYKKGPGLQGSTLELY
eukprot:1190296-Prorocentrum_minimum.AAC.2